MKKKDKEAQRHKEFCKKYITPDWDGCEAIEYFARFQEADPENKYVNKPKNDLFIGLQDLHYAKNDAYCKVNPAFEKEKVIERLEKSLLEPISIPSKVQNPEKYKEVFVNQVKEILENIRLNKYPFQKNNTKTD